MQIAGARFVITGGASLIGSHIAERLLADGASEVISLDNLSLGSEGQLGHLRGDDRLKIVRGDILRLETLLERFQGAAGVFHVAGYLPVPLSQDLGRGIEVNVTGTQNVLEASRWAGVRKVVLSSSVGVYGNPSGEVSEDYPFNRGVKGFSAPAAIYAATKIIGEHLAQIYTDRYQVEHVSLRYSTVYGVRQHDRAINARLLFDPLERIRKGLRPIIYGDGSEVHDYINAVDVAGANIAAMTSDVRSGAYTIATGRSVSVKEIVDIALELYDSPLKPEYSTQGRGLTAAIASSLVFDVSAARRDLHWQAGIDVRAGLEMLKNWRDAQGDV